MNSRTADPVGSGRSNAASPAEGRFSEDSFLQASWHIVNTAARNKAVHFFMPNSKGRKKILLSISDFNSAGKAVKPLAKEIFGEGFYI
jgi:hypothetical protein